MWLFDVRANATSFFSYYQSQEVYTIDVFLNSALTNIYIYSINLVLYMFLFILLWSNIIAFLLTVLYLSDHFY